MNLNLYRFTGDPKALVAAWERVSASIDPAELLLNIVTVGDDGLSFLDACPTEANFQGWINGDAWAWIKGELGGEVTVTRLGEVRSAVAQDGIVQVTRPHAHSH